MVSKGISLILVFLMVTPVLMITCVESQKTSNSIHYSSIQTGYNLAETDLNRVNWTGNTFENPGFEEWVDIHNPKDVYTLRSTEKATWTDSTYFSEGAKSVGVSVRAIDPSHPSSVRITQSAWTYWDNPTNTTLNLDWFMDYIGNPLDNDYFQIDVRINNRHMYYNIACDFTYLANTSSAVYFSIDGPLKTWNHLHLNLTADYIEAFGMTPTQFQVINWWILSKTNQYTRIYMDDVWLVNGTTIKIGGSIKNGNFEGGAGWVFETNTDPSDISQSAVSHEGASSMNMTALSYGYSSYASASYSVGKRIAELNQGQLSFWWRIDSWTNPSVNTYSYLRIDGENATTSISIWYYLGIGGSGSYPPLMGGENIRLKADGFNVTDTWNFFNRNIWQDIVNSMTCEDFWIDEIIFYTRAGAASCSLSVLIDDADFTVSILNDMGYEDQGIEGSAIRTWNMIFGTQVLTVTNFTCNGIKAANLSLLDVGGFGAYQYQHKRAVNPSTELILDFNIYIDTFNQTSNDFLYIELLYGDEISIGYIVANGSSNLEENGFDHIVVLQDTLVFGQWLNFQIDLVHTYESVVGFAPDTTLEYIYIYANCGTGSSLRMFFDDFYIYYDPEPEVSNVEISPLHPEAGGSATISATVIDATIESVIVNYRVNSGMWQQVSMSYRSGSMFEGQITSLQADAIIEFSITATDAFGKATTALNETEYFTFVVGSQTTTTITTTSSSSDFDPLVLLLIVAVLSVAGGVTLVYLVIIRKK